MRKRANELPCVWRAFIDWSNFYVSFKKTVTEYLSEVHISWKELDISKVVQFMMSPQTEQGLLATNNRFPLPFQAAFEVCQTAVSSAHD
jgi:hypothetical protein